MEDWMTCLYAFVGCGAFCFIFEMRRWKLILCAAGIGMVARAVCLLLSDMGGISQLVLATIVTATLAEIFARVLKNAGHSTPDYRHHSTGAGRRHLLHHGGTGERRHGDVRPIRAGNRGFCRRYCSGELIGLRCHTDFDGAKERPALSWKQGPAPSGASPCSLFDLSPGTREESQPLVSGSLPHCMPVIVS